MAEKKKKEEIIWSLLRIGLGLILLWAFFDKLFGLGFATAADKSWLLGTSPTYGFLKFGTAGLFASFFQGLSTYAGVIDIIFMLGLFGIGVAMILGVASKIAGYSGAVMMFLMWLAVFPPEHNPLMDEHIIYLLIFVAIANGYGRMYSVLSWWKKTKFVRKHRIWE